MAVDDNSPCLAVLQAAVDAAEALDSPDVAARLDASDPLHDLHEEFHVPPTGDAAKIRSVGEPTVYLCGNSLGLQPKGARKAVEEEMAKWERWGVEGHFMPETRPWVSIDETVHEPMARVVGAKPVEVCVMNTLTANIHFLMVPFYRPTKDRFKIVMESKAFPSDHFAITSQLQFHGIDPADGLIEIKPRDGETYLRTEDIEAVIADNAASVALVLLSGVQYYTGQAFEIERITKAGHAAGAVVGWDLAHATGNVELQLHDWDVDFAMGCTYKYLNSGPGCTGYAFVHEKHATTDRPRFAGWWGHDKSDRFEMHHDFRPTPGAFGFSVSNPSVLPLATLRASLELFDRATMPALRAKSVALTAYLEHLLRLQLPGVVKIMTPPDAAQRGAQLSLEFTVDLHEVQRRLSEEGVVVDVRHPSAMRVAPAPLYNTFTDVATFVRVLKAVLDEQADA